jgi:hypothetical protein
MIDSVPHSLADVYTFSALQTNTAGIAHQSTRFYRASSNVNNRNHHRLSQTGRLHQQGGGHKTEGPATHVRPRLYYIIVNINIYNVYFYLAI